VGFTIVVTAYDGFSNAVTGFTGAISLTDSTGTLSPVTWNSWSNGLATPVMTVTRATANDQITATLAATPTMRATSAPFAVVPNVPATVALEVNPTVIPLGATSQLTETVWDAFTNLVADGTVVTFTTTSGTFANGLPVYARTTTSGVATAVLTSSCSAGGITLTAQAGDVLTQTSASFVAPGLPASLALALGSNVLPVGGATTALTATLRDCGSNLMGSGIPVSFTIAPISAAIAPSATATTGGVASATLT
jgi:hypothetical protein